MNSLIIYSTTDGQTKKICETIKENSINKNSYEIVSLEEASNKEIEKYEKIIRSNHSGTIKYMNTEKIGWSLVELGCGRSIKTNKLEF